MPFFVPLSRLRALCADVWLWACVLSGFLMQVDKLVQLLESPIFLPLRLHLLDASYPLHHQLLTALYGATPLDHP